MTFIDRPRSGARIVALIAACGALAAGEAAGQAAGYPTKPIRLVVPFAPAGAGDLFGRTVATRLRDVLGQQVNVENRGGAGGNIGLGFVAKSAPDGYTLALGNLGTLAINPSLYREIPYDSVKSFEPVSLFGGTPLLLVIHPSVPAKTAKELFALAKARPGALNYASAGSGGPTHLTMEIIKSQRGINVVHVPFKANVAAITSVLTGDTQMMISTIMTPLPHMQTGRLRGIAVTTAKRQPAVPDMPTLGESGMPGFDVSGWYGILTPAGTPRDIVMKLNAVIVQLARAPEVMDLFTKQGLEVFASTPGEFSAKIESEMVKWGKVVRETKATVD